MRCKSLALALTVALGGIASAQPGPPPQPPVDTTITSDPGPPEPTPQPQPQPVVAQPQPMMQTQTTTEAPGERPEGFAIALGLGYALPTSLQTPNITSARIRLSSGFEIEPAIRISNESTSNETAAGETTDKHTVFGLVVLGRLNLIQRGRADFNVLASLGFTNDKPNPEGDFNSVTTNSFGIGWGIGVGY